MLLNRTVNKKILETIVHETFSNFGSISSSSLLDSLVPSKDLKEYHRYKSMPRRVSALFEKD